MLEHGGRLREAARRYDIPLADWLDLSTGIAPWPFPLPAIPEQAWTRLPESDDGLEAAACLYYGAERVLPLAGSQAAIQALPRLRRGGRVGVLSPCYAEHAHAWRQAGHLVREVGEAEVEPYLDSLDVLLVVNPNNPTGRVFEPAELLAWHARLQRRGGWLLVDEAFMDCTPQSSLAACSNRPGLIVLRSFGKFFGLAGARLGFALGERPLLQALAEQLGPWTVNGPVRHVAQSALRDRQQQRQQRERLLAASQRLEELLRRHGWPPAGGSALFQRLVDPRCAALHDYLARRGILTRQFEQPASLRLGLPADEAAWARLDAALLGFKGLLMRDRGRTLMVQGTTSDAGKSTLVTALCRWLARRGVAVVPFKPQNMALNSAVTADGGEIGRAQAVQAQACRLAPHTDMNPVLLKPNTDIGAQVIIHGRAVTSMDAAAYHDYKRVAMEAVLASHGRLAAAYRVVMVEGAGSPAEINLRANDIANMGFAEAVDCPVILVADIDRGGVFAHLVGTLELLSDSERERVKGFVINRFRGDIALLQPGLDWLEARTGKPVLGVLPYVSDLHLEAEDAIDTRQAAKAGPRLKVVVPVLPRISNHTDFDPLRLHPQVELSFVGPGQALPSADLIVLPGSKSVRADLAALRERGWDEAILRHLRYGGRLLGICGGLQMLGERLHDPLGLEGAAGSSAGLGLLALETTLEADKQLRNVQGRLSLEDAPLSGYEIHAGVTRGEALARPAVVLDDGRADGARSVDGNVMGTYLHGLFESTAACSALLRWAGLREVQAVDYQALRERDIERLADLVERHLDTGRLLALCGEPHA